MYRRRSSLQQQVGCCDSEPAKISDQNPQPSDANDDRPDLRQPAACQYYSMFALLTSWRERASLWFNAELARLLFDDKAYESNKILPSLMSFILGLLLVKVYGDRLDSAITSCYEHLKSALNILYGLLARLTAKDVEIVPILGVLTLLWIGALRILFNFARQLIQLPRFY